MTKPIVALCVGGLFFLATGASSCDSNHVDAHNGPSSTIDRSPARIVAMPDQFPNVATKCAGFGHNRVWVVSHTKDDVTPQITTDESCP